MVVCEGVACLVTGQTVVDTGMVDVTTTVDGVSQEEIDGGQRVKDKIDVA